jgi:Family of unknown function (DUF5681)
LSAVIASALSERVAITENGHRHRITKLEAAIKQLVNRAAGGESRVMQLLIQLVQAEEAQMPQSDAKRVDDADAIVMAELKRRLGRQS